jgi:site-specific recombinase XerD
VGHRAGRPPVGARGRRRVHRCQRAAGLPAELDLHCLRHSYITHLVEFDYPERFVSEQAGHRYASTTAIYTGVSDDYRSRLVRRSLEARPELWEGTL